MHDTSATHFTGTIPDHYERSLGPVIFSGYAADLARRAADPLPARVLETAAGTGIVTRMLCDRLPGGTALTATDLNEDMLDRARTKFRPEEPVTFLAADATNLPFPAQSFDAVVCQFGLMFFPDKPRAHREARRVLRGGGRYVFNVWDSHAHNAFARVAHRTAAECSPADPPAFFQVPFSCHDVVVIRDDLRDAGFREIDVTTLPLEVPVADPADFARGLVFGTPLLEQIRGRPGIDPQDLVAALTAALSGELGLPSRPLRLQAHVIEAC